MELWMEFGECLCCFNCLIVGMVDIPKHTVILHRSLFWGFAQSPVGTKDIKDPVICSTRLSSGFF